MRDKLYAYLKSQKTGVTSNELVEQVLKIKGSPPVISEKLICTAIEGDRRFALDEHRLWRIVEKGGIPLSEAEFALISLLTIERIDKLRVIVEISAQKLKGGKITERFHTVINHSSSVIPSLQLPADIAQEIKECGVPIERAVRSLLNFIGDAVLVGYDIHSLINQLNLILQKSNEDIENSLLCLKHLTKRLIPDLYQKSLNEAASFLKLPIIDVQRTENEICTIAEIFSRYIELLKKQGFGTVEEILEFQYPNIEYVDFRKYAFDKNFLWAIPQKPGVYKIKNKGGEVIYVGKAKNLKSRVSSYFCNTADRVEKVADILNNVYTIEYEETGSELAALVKEFRLIKQYQPKLNQQLEVHERAVRYGNLKNFVLILPSSAEMSLDLFFLREGLPLQQYEILKDAVNFSELERILDSMYFNTAGMNCCLPTQTDDNENFNNFPQNPHEPSFSKGELKELTDVEIGEIDIALSWVDTNKDYINYINVDTVGNKDRCLKLLKDYIHDEETLQKKHFRVK